LEIRYRNVGIALQPGQGETRLPSLLLQQSLEANDDFMKSYNAIIDEQLELGIAEPVVNDDE
jgi:hypothetical protein